MNTLPLVWSEQYQAHCLMIDNSALELLQGCPRAFEYSFARKRVRAVDKPAQNFGASGHMAWKWRYSHYGEVVTEQLEAEMCAVIDKHFLDNPQPMNDYRTPGLAKDMVMVYNQVYPREQWRVVMHNGKPQVEVSFAHKLGEVRMLQGAIIPVIFMGRLDLALRDNANQLWVLDHKTAQRFGLTFWLEQEMLWQCKGYVWAYRESYGEKPMGYIIDGIRVTPPRKEDEFSETRSFRRDDFNRAFYIVSDDQLDEWKQNILTLCQEIMFHASNDFFPMKTKHCVNKYGACQYVSVCKLPIQSRLAQLNSGEFQDNTWSPLNKPNESNII